LQVDTNRQAAGLQTGGFFVSLHQILPILTGGPTQR
jgi:hypothetical protein